jgi:hypothetical protein
MKNKYIKPEMTVMHIEQRGIICTSQVNQVSNNADLNEEISGGHGIVRSRQYDAWDDEDDWEDE